MLPCLELSPNRLAPRRGPIAPESSATGGRSLKEEHRGDTDCRDPHHLRH